MSNLEPLVAAAIDQINRGNITLADVLNILAPTPEADEVVKGQIPLPQIITEEQEAALKKVVDVFGKVVPQERRILAPEEVSALVEEKETLDTLIKMAKSRLDNGIKVAIHNHLDVVAEEQGLTKDATRNGDGHWNVNGEVFGDEGVSKKFTREVRVSSPSVTLADLEALVDDEDVDFTHEDLLAITTQTRVMDDNKLMLYLKKKPSLVMALSKAVRPGKATASINLRNV